MKTKRDRKNAVLRPGYEQLWRELEEAVLKHGQSGVARLDCVAPYVVYASRIGRGNYLPNGKLLAWLGYELRYVKIETKLTAVDVANAALEHLRVMEPGSERPGSVA